MSPVNGPRRRQMFEQRLDGRVDEEDQRVGEDVVDVEVGQPDDVDEDARKRHQAKKLRQMVLEEKLVLSINKKTLFSRPLMFPGKKNEKNRFFLIKKIADFLSRTVSVFELKN